MSLSTRLSLVVVAMTAPAAAQQPGPVAEALVGVWKGTQVPGASLDVITGATVALIGWHAQLELAKDGRYTWTEYRQGELGGCRISTLRKVSGAAVTRGTELTLGPARGTEAKTDACSRAKSYSNRPVNLPAQRFAVKLDWTETVAGLETPKLSLKSPDGSVETFEYTSEPAQAWPPARFGNVPAQPIPADLPSLWVGYHSKWFEAGDPARFRPPPDDAHWIKLGPDGRYEWAGWKHNLIPGPGCSVGALRYERGRYRVAKQAYNWAMVTEPDSGFVLQRRQGCGTEDGDRIIPIERVPSPFLWSIGRDVSNKEVLEIKCAGERRERTRWQFLLCHWQIEFRALMVRTRQ